MKYLEIPIEVNGSVEDARLETYILDTPVEKIQIKKRPMIVICPGGGYEKLSYREGEPIAMQFLAKGYHACVLRYSVAPARYPVPLLELGQVMRIARGAYELRAPPASLSDGGGAAVLPERPLWSCCCAKEGISESLNGQHASDQRC